MSKPSNSKQRASRLARNLARPYTEQPIFVRLVKRFVAHDLGRAAASLAYYVLFSLFPALILMTMLLDLFDLHPFLTDLLRGFIPVEILNVFASYMDSIPKINSGAANTSFLIGSVLLLIYFTMRTMNCLLRSLRVAYGYRSDRSALRNQLSVFLSTILLLVGVLVALGLLTVGRRMLELLAPVLHFTASGISTWNFVRFLLLGGVLFGILFCLYYLTPRRKYRPLSVLPGTLIALVSWLVFSFIFAAYMETIGSGKYSVLYGALGTVIILLLWLYFSGFVILIGAEINGIYLEMREEMAEKHIQVPQYRYLWMCGWTSKHGRKK